MAANQKAPDALPPNSGTWRVEGIPGLKCSLSCDFPELRSATTRRRRIGETGPWTAGRAQKRAKEKAMDRWNAIKPSTDDDEVQLSVSD